MADSVKGRTSSPPADKVNSISLGRGQGEGGRSSSYRPLTRSRCAPRSGSTSPQGEVKQLPLLRTNSRSESVMPFSVCLVVPGKTRLPGQGCRVSASIGPGIVKEQSVVIGALPAHASLSLRAWRKRRLLARSWKPGDRMRPLGMQGTKKLHDIFSDGKVPPTLRHRLPVIECQGEIVWIPGFRIAQGWAVGPDEATALQLTVELNDGISTCRAR